MKFGHFNDRQCSRNFRQRFTGRKICFQQIAKEKVFLCRPSGFADRGIIVVRTAHSRVGRIVGTTPMSESRSSVSHVKAEGDVAIEHIFDALHHIFGRTCFMFPSPVVEPSAPELTAHQRSFGTKLFQFLKLLVDISPSSEIHSPNQVVECVIGKVTAPVALKQRHIGKTGFTYQITHGRNVWFIGSVRAILVLHLNHDNVSSFIHLQRSQLFADLFHKNAYPFHIIRIKRAQGHIFFL